MTQRRRQPRVTPTPAPVKDDVYRIAARHRPPVTIEFPNGYTWLFPADPDVELVGALLDIDEGVNSDDGRVIARAVVEGKDLLLDIARELNDDVPDDPRDFRVGAEQIMEFIGIMMGGQTAQDAVYDALADEDLYEDAGGGAKPADSDADAVGGTEDAEPVPLSRRSSRRSSGSASGTRSRRTTGAGSRGGSSASTSAKRAAAAG